MKNLKLKIILFAVIALSLMFFSNDFGIVDIEKTAIITAIGIDLKDGKYEISAQIAVPEATDNNSENQKTQISATGDTVGAAIKRIGDSSGWYPQLHFCNLIILGNGTESENVIKMIDYFAKTLRLQDSAILVLAEGSAKELLEITTPLDSISSFALQKILLKTEGFDRDVATNDIKSFCSGYYSYSGSSFIPLVKAKKIQTSEAGGASSGDSTGGNQETGGSSGGSQSGAESSGQEKNSYVFDATTTALYKDGFLVGTLTEEQTIAFNAIRGEQMRYTTVTALNVQNGLTEKPHNYLFTVLRCVADTKLFADENELTFKINVNVYGKITDQNADYSDSTVSKNIVLPEAVIRALESKMSSDVENVVKTTVNTGCDALKIGEKLYRFNHNHYYRYKDDYLTKMKTEINVTVTGQK